MQQQLSVHGIEINQRKILSKYLAVTAFAFAMFVILEEQSTYPVGNLFAMDIAYAAFPFLVFSVIFVAYAYSWTLVKEIWQKKHLKLFSVVIGTGYAVFYIFSTNIVAPPDLPMPPGVHSFILPFQVYSLMAMWPDVEFYSSTLNLAGYFSVGNVLLVSSMAVMVSFASTLLVQNIGNRRASSKGGAGSVIGTVFTSLSSNACCCCAPVFLPLVFAFFGVGASSSAAEAFTYQTMPIFNLLWMATLLLLVASILLSVKRIGSCNG